MTGVDTTSILIRPDPVVNPADTDPALNHILVTDVVRRMTPVARFESHYQGYVNEQDPNWKPEGGPYVSRDGLIAAGCTPGTEGAIDPVEQNEDASFIVPLEGDWVLAGVVDGAGGTRDGEVAAFATLQHLAACKSSKDFEKVVNSTSSEVKRILSETDAGKDASAVYGTVLFNRFTKEYKVAHQGDVTAVLWKQKSGIIFETVSHTLANEAILQGIDPSKIPPILFRNPSNYVGKSSGSFVPSISEMKIAEDGATLIMFSDGWSEHFSSKQTAEFLKTRFHLSAKELYEEMISELDEKLREEKILHPDRSSRDSLKNDNRTIVIVKFDTAAEVVRDMPYSAFVDDALSGTLPLVPNQTGVAPPCSFQEDEPKVPFFKRLKEGLHGVVSRIPTPSLRRVKELFPNASSSRVVSEVSSGKPYTVPETGTFYPASFTKLKDSLTESSIQARKKIFTTAKEVFRSVVSVTSERITSALKLEPLAEKWNEKILAADISEKDREDLTKLCLKLSESAQVSSNKLTRQIKNSDLYVQADVYLDTVLNVLKEKERVASDGLKLPAESLTKAVYTKTNAYFESLINGWNAEIGDADVGHVLSRRLQYVRENNVVKNAERVADQISGFAVRTAEIERLMSSLTEVAKKLPRSEVPREILPDGKRKKLEGNKEEVRMTNPSVTVKKYTSAFEDALRDVVGEWEPGVATSVKTFDRLASWTDKLSDLDEAYQTLEKAHRMYREFKGRTVNRDLAPTTEKVLAGAFGSGVTRRMYCEGAYLLTTKKLRTEQDYSDLKKQAQVVLKQVERAQRIDEAYVPDPQVISRGGNKYSIPQAVVRPYGKVKESIRKSFLQDAESENYGLARERRLRKHIPRN